MKPPEWPDITDVIPETPGDDASVDGDDGADRDAGGQGPGPTPKLPSLKRPAGVLTLRSVY